MNSTRLTVAIPTYNRQTYLRQTLESLQGQTEQSFKVILFDNASSYDIKHLISLFPSLSITLEQNASNMGNQANFERVMTYPFDTPYVMIFHDDDTIHPNYFKKALPVLDHNENIYWVGSFIKYTHSTADMMKFWDDTSNVLMCTYNRLELADLFMSNLPVGFSPVIYRTSTLSNTKPNATRFYKWLDRPFMLDAAGGGQAAIFHFPFVNYRIHPSQDSAQKYDEHIPEMINLTEYISSAGNISKGRKYATANALRTAIQNASSIKEFSCLLNRFRERGLYRTVDIRPYAIYWLFRVWAKRISDFYKK